ncbi:uncharacterized protein RJT21DRAFT_1235 [Scheffersomyces amazonensis]|uniref:uncharacterized protein n=1 Tax=Scheffersomyces amazonensis TaxID=1078765 RepID=UPI00315DD612
MRSSVQSCLHNEKKQYFLNRGELLGYDTPFNKFLIKQGIFYYPRFIINYFDRRNKCHKLKYSSDSSSSSSSLFTNSNDSSSSVTELSDIQTAVENTPILNLGKFTAISTEETTPVSTKIVVPTPKRSYCNTNVLFDLSRYYLEDEDQEFDEYFTCDDRSFEDHSEYDAVSDSSSILSVITENNEFDFTPTSGVQITPSGNSSCNNNNNNNNNNSVNESTSLHFYNLNNFSFCSSSKFSVLNKGRPSCANISFL